MVLGGVKDVLRIATSNRNMNLNLGEADDEDAFFFLFVGAASSDGTSSLSDFRFWVEAVFSTADSTAAVSGFVTSISAVAVGAPLSDLCCFTLSVPEELVRGRPRFEGVGLGVAGAGEVV